LASIGSWRKITLYTRVYSYSDFRLARCFTKPLFTHLYVVFERGRCCACCRRAVLIYSTMSAADLLYLLLLSIHLKPTDAATDSCYYELHRMERHFTLQIGRSRRVFSCRTYARETCAPSICRRTIRRTICTHAIGWKNPTVLSRVQREQQVRLGYYATSWLLIGNALYPSGIGSGNFTEFAWARVNDRQCECSTLAGTRLPETHAHARVG